MDGRESSKVQHQLQAFGEQYTSPYFSYPSSFSFFSPNHHTHFTMFSTLEFNELNDARAESDSGNFNSYTPNEDSSCAKSDTDSCSEAGGDASDEEEVSLDELLLDGKTKEKIELLAAMVGVDTTDPMIVLNEVVRVLKVLKRINQF
ncbi:hypothetical protein VNO77_32956 [Canavalia gladiata]|uniref:Uncharacterized protein n=1 Tax=Canavalia gladiata TaxID=3824 RepID=A0AAN9PXX9_CANGL